MSRICADFQFLVIFFVFIFACFCFHFVVGGGVVVGDSGFY
jgi:hypothetical protein